MSEDFKEGDPYKLILIDDESIIREGISSCVQWGSNGFDLVEMFENGREALRFIEGHSIDVVISDINMPHMDGIELSRILADRFPEIVVLLLTGYDDFEYAQAAVKNQVRQFLLKPITAQELSNILSNLKKDLDVMKSRIRQQELMREKLKMSLPLLKERFLNRLVLGKVDPASFSIRKEYVGWNDTLSFYQIVYVQIPDAWSDLDTLAFTDHMKQMIQGSDEIFQNPEENSVLLLQGSDSKKLAERSVETAKQVFQYAGLMDMDQVSVGIGDVVDTNRQLHRSYDGAETAASYSGILGIAQVLTVDQVRRKDPVDPSDFNEKVGSLIQSIKEGHRQQTGHVLEEIFSYIHEHLISPAEIYHYFNRLHVRLADFLPNIGLSSIELNRAEPPVQVFHTVKSAAVFLKKWFLK